MSKSNEAVSAVSEVSTNEAVSEVSTVSTNKAVSGVSKESMKKALSERFGVQEVKSKAARKKEAEVNEILKIRSERRSEWFLEDWEELANRMELEVLMKLQAAIISGILMSEKSL